MIIQEISGFVQLKTSLGGTCPIRLFPSGYNIQLRTIKCCKWKIKTDLPCPLMVTDFFYLSTMVVMFQLIFSYGIALCLVLFLQW